ncbi:hypothetical protein SLA2020_011610 [Shorea laevis]
MTSHANYLTNPTKSIHDQADPTQEYIPLTEPNLTLGGATDGQADPTPRVENLRSVLRRCHVTAHDEADINLSIN